MSSDHAPWLAEAATSLVGAAGEHYVMTHLLLRGALAALTPRGAKDTDILVASADGLVVAEVQVKARSGKSGKGWRMSDKNQTARDRLFYCLVDFAHVPDWSVYVMPSKVVATYLEKSHEDWLSTPGKNGKARKDWSGRFILPDKPKPGWVPGEPKGDWLNDYQDRWDLILGACCRE